MKRELSRSERVTVVSLITAVASVCGILFYRRIYINGNGLRCILYDLTGLYCPGCGMGRASLSLLHGDFIGAMKNNPFILLLILIGIYILVRLADWAITGQNHIDRYIPPKLLIGIFVVLIIYGVLRNIPCFPFTALQPQ